MQPGLPKPWCHLSPQQARTYLACVVGSLRSEVSM